MSLFLFLVPKRVLKPLRRHKHRKRKKKKPGSTTEKESNSSHAIPSSSTLLYKILPKTTKSPVSVDRLYPAGNDDTLIIHSACLMPFIGYSNL